MHCLLQDVEPGQAARPQLAAHAMAIDSALKKLKGSPFVVEVKFDGERVQVCLLLVLHC